MSNSVKSLEKKRWLINFPRKLGYINVRNKCLTSEHVKQGITVYSKGSVDINVFTDEFNNLRRNHRL